MASFRRMLDFGPKGAESSFIFINYPIYKYFHSKEILTIIHTTQNRNSHQTRKSAHFMEIIGDIVRTSIVKGRPKFWQILGIDPFDCAQGDQKKYFFVDYIRVNLC